MADDDGLLVNFLLPSDAPIAPKPKFKGAWKDRLSARKSHEYGVKKAHERTTAHHEPPTSHGSALLDAGIDHERPVKRPRLSENYTGDQRLKPVNGEFVSSLFTYNPAPKVAVEDPVEEDETPVVPSNAPLDDEVSKFTSLGLSSSLAAHLLRKMNIKAPTAIQRRAIQQLCENDTDAFIQAQTGSGKTLAYLLPIVERITAISRTMKDAGESFDRHAGLFAIILAPTRELSKQISTVLESLLSCCHWIVASTVIGGEKKKSEKARLRKGLNILVATPGRLADHLNNTEVLDVSNVRWLVLDEGDRLMELGFEDDIQRLIGVLNLRSRKSQKKPIPGLPEHRTTVLCSATIKANVEQLRSFSLKDPVSIAVDPAEATDGDLADGETFFSAPVQLKQSYAIVPAKQRLVTLVAALKQTFKRKGSVMKCIVFMSCADSVDFHFELLTRGDKTKAVDDKENAEDIPTTRRPSQDSRKIAQGTSISEKRTQGVASSISSKENDVQVFRLHGSLPQAVRTGTLMAFAKTATPAVLVCTDVAARGLDLPNIDLVIEYDAPFSKDDHIHRIGRTARAGKDGRAMIFLQPGCEEGYVEILKESKPRNLIRQDGVELLKKGFSATRGDSSTTWEDRATDLQLDVERWVSDNPKHLEQARQAYQSHLRAYTTHVAAERGIFNMQVLHLGHMAKAFALRDKPGSIRVPGLRPTKQGEKKSQEVRRQQVSRNAGSQGRSVGRERLEAAPATDAQDARKRMMAKVRSMGGASEFNLG